MEPAIAVRNGYRASQKKQGRKTYLLFEAVNTVSYVFVAGNLLTLLALGLGASSTVIGILAAFAYVSYLFMPLAKFLVPRWGLVRTWGVAWVLRYVFGAFLVGSPLLALAGQTGWAMALLLGSNLLFHVFRGLGLVSISPLSNELSAGKDRGEFLSRKTILVSLSSLVSGLVLGLGLGSRASPWAYVVFIALGTILGGVSAFLIFRIPEPAGTREGARTPFLQDLRTGLAKKSFRNFMITYALMVFLTSLGRPFLLVYAKQVYGYGDDLAMLFTVIGSLGVIAMGQLSRIVLDRLGAKPLLVIFTLAFLLSCLPLVFLPILPGMAGLGLMGALFFVSMLGSAGTDNAAQAYFFGIVDDRLQFNMGMLFYLVTGAAGGLGSYLGGVWLDGLVGLAGTLPGWRLFFLLIVVLGLPVLAGLGRLVPLGSRRVSDALAALFSPRDLRAMNLLRRLDQPLTMSEEQAVMSGLPNLSSELVVGQMIQRLDSPLTAVRGQALLVLERVPLSPEVAVALIHHLETHAFGTAFRAARILGQRQIHQAAPALRACLDSQDHLLRAYAANALGELGDQAARPALEALLGVETDYLVLVHAIGALARIGDRTSMAVLLELLGRGGLPPNLRDEVMFGLAGILGLADWLYPRYTAWLDNQAAGAGLLQDDLQDLADSATRGNLPELVARLADPDAWTQDFLVLAGNPPGRWAGPEDGATMALLAACLDHQAVREYMRFRYFCTAWLVWNRLAASGLVAA